MNDLNLTRDAQGRLTLHQSADAGGDVADVQIRRVFPWSLSSKYISVRSPDGKELAMISDPADLTPPVRQLIEQQLADNSLIPRIETIDQLTMQFGFQDWVVQTDRGRVAFRVQEREDVRFLSNTRLRIKDADGNVYELPDMDGLDPSSRRNLAVLL